MGRILGLLILCVSLSFAQTYPLNVDGRHLEDANGTPFFVNAEAGWSMMANLSHADIHTYLTDRASKGINTILVNLLEHYFSTNAPNNINNDPPFSGAAFQSTAGANYFTFCDSVVNKAAALGVNLMISPAYTGYACGTEGWCAEIQAASVAQMKAWGVWVGNRYKNKANIVWVIGGDADPTGYSGVQERLDSVAAGIRQADTVYPNRVMTAHNAPESYARDPWSGKAWLTLDGAYSYTTTMWSFVDVAYNASPTKPFLMFESAYENEHSSTAQTLRAQAYWAVTRGACGHIFGNNPIWLFGSGWASELDSDGSTSMQYMGNLFRERAWWALLPDRDSTIVTAGTLSGTSRATAAYASDSSHIVAYLPTNREITVNLNYLKTNRTIKCYWYDPILGTYSYIGSYARGSQAFTPTGSQDWVFVAEVVSHSHRLISR